jgi:uncharacterized protein (UPF0333 family)
MAPIIAPTMAPPISSEQLFDAINKFYKKTCSKKLPFGGPQIVNISSLPDKNITMNYDMNILYIDPKMKSKGKIEIINKKARTGGINDSILINIDPEPTPEKTQCDDVEMLKDLFNKEITKILGTPGNRPTITLDGSKSDVKPDTIIHNMNINSDSISYIVITPLFI